MSNPLKWLTQPFVKLLLRWLVIASIAWGLFVAIATLCLNPQTAAIDTQILLAIRHLHTPTLDRLMVLITYLGEPLILFPFTLGLGGWLLRQKRQRAALSLVMVIGGSLALNIGLKELFARHRPTLWEQILEVPFYSFPSGHAMVSLVFYAVLAYGLARQFRQWQLAICTLSMGLIATIGFSRLYIGVHWPTDILGGYAAGLVWLTLCWRLRSVIFT